MSDMKKENENDADCQISEAEIDYNLMESFPASDPPSWTLGLDPDKGTCDEFEGEQPSADEPSHQKQPHLGQLVQKRSTNN